MQKQPTPHITKDGSSSLYSQRHGQLYHSNGGAVSESRFVFFELPELSDAIRENREITIFEMGFGTGLNLLLALDYTAQAESPAPLHFYSVEAFPISTAVFEDLNYSRFLDDKTLTGRLAPVFDALNPGMNSFQLIPDLPVYLHLFYGVFADFPDTNIKADFILHDAFSPRVNPELWTSGVFEKLRRFSSEDAVLTTYCSATKARAAMAAAGWKVARAPGVLGKRETTIASPDARKLTGFKRVNEERLTERLSRGDFE